MTAEILVNITHHEVRVAILSKGVLQEIHIERNEHQGIIGNIYKGRLNRILPGIQAAFVDLGLERSAFLHISDILGYEDNLDMDIRKVLHQGQELFIQVYKDPMGSKGARITTQFTIPSRYLVFTPGVFQVVVSQKITDESERKRLMSMISPDSEGGYIFRTLAEGATQENIDSDKKFLQTLWHEVSVKKQNVKVGDIVYQEIPIVLRVLRDLVGYNIEKIRVDDKKAVNEMQAFAKNYIPSLVDKIQYYESETPIFDIYSVEDELQKALQRKVYLKSGGHLIIDQTEAMTTIDVNTGSYIGTNNLEHTLFKTNLEAIEVIARQLRLRNLGGIIIVDFIDMTDTLHKEHILNSLKLALANDSAKVQVSELSSLGLVQLTRKRARESLEHILCIPCPLCQQRGSIKSIETVCYEIFRELNRIATIHPWAGYMVIASQSVIDKLGGDESIILTDLEVKLNKPIKLKVEASFTQEQYNILPLS